MPKIQNFITNLISELKYCNYLKFHKIPFLQHVHVSLLIESKWKCDNRFLRCPKVMDQSKTFLSQNVHVLYVNIEIHSKNSFKIKKFK